jgi:hypothetical protein
MLAGMLLMYFLADAQDWIAPSIIQWTAVAGMLFFCSATVYMIVRLRSKRPGLILNAAGIQDYSSASALRMVEWDHIMGLESVEIQGQPLLLLFVENPESLISGESKWKQQLLKGNLEMFGTPVVLSAISLDCSFSEMVEAVSSFAETYKGPPDLPDQADQIPLSD